MLIITTLNALRPIIGKLKFSFEGKHYTSPFPLLSCITVFRHHLKIPFLFPEPSRGRAGGWDRKKEAPHEKFHSC